MESDKVLQEWYEYLNFACLKALEDTWYLLPIGETSKVGDAVISLFVGAAWHKSPKEMHPPPYLDGIWRGVRDWNGRAVGAPVQCMTCVEGDLSRYYLVFRRVDVHLTVPMSKSRWSCGHRYTGGKHCGVCLVFNRWVED